MSERLPVYRQENPIPEALLPRYRKLAEYAGRVTHTKGSLLFISREVFHKPNPASDSPYSLLVRQATSPLRRADTETYVSFVDSLVGRRKSVKLVEMTTDDPKQIIESKRHQELADFQYSQLRLAVPGEVTEEGLDHLESLITYMDTNLTRPKFLPAYSNMPAIDPNVQRYQDKGIAMVDLDAPELKHEVFIKSR